VTAFLLAATVVFLPLLKPPGPQNTAPVDVLAMGYVGLGLITLARSRGRLHLPAAVPVGLILVAGLIASAGSVNPRLGLLNVLVDTYLFVLFLVAANDLRDNPRLLRVILVVWTIASLCWASLLIGTINHVLPDGLASLLGQEEVKRAAAAAKNPNMAASYLVTSFFVVLSSPWPRSRPMRVLGAAWVIYAVHLTGSVAGLCALAAGLAYLAACAWMRRSGSTQAQAGAVSGATMLTVALVAAVVVTLNGLPRVGISDVEAMAVTQQQGAFKYSLGRLDQSVEARLRLWTNGWKAAGPQVVVGIGPGEARELELDGYRLRNSLHSDYVGFLIERGVLALIAYLALCCLLLGWGARLAIRGTALGRGGWTLGGAVPANLVLGGSHDTFHFRHMWLLYALMWAALLLARPWGTAAADAATGEGELTHAGR
jgi:O-antigen ligase